MAQKELGALSQFENALLWNPAWAPSVSVGKYAARATPIFALAAIMRRCAAAISGRRSSSADGTPVGIVGRWIAMIAGLIENVEADTPSSAAMACSISARCASVCAA